MSSKSKSTGGLKPGSREYERRKDMNKRRGPKRAPRKQEQDEEEENEEEGIFNSILLIKMQIYHVLNEANFFF